MRMCCPLSSRTSRPSGSGRVRLRARPPNCRDASCSVTAWPARTASTPAASPAQPPPTTATFIGPVSKPAQGLDLPGEPELAHRCEAHALVQHLEAVALDLAQEGAVDAGHHQARLLAAPVLRREQREGFVVEAVRAIGLELHQRAEAVGVGALGDLVRL